MVIWTEQLDLNTLQTHVTLADCYMTNLYYAVTTYLYSVQCQQLSTETLGALLREMF